MNTLKLNKKRTMYIALAFFTILMLWQVYNSYVPLMLEDIFTNNLGAGNYKYLIGIIMAADNMFALFMIPLFGAISDKTVSKMGKRMPYIIGGTLLSVVLFPFIPVLYATGSLLGLFLIMGLVLISMNVYRAPAVALMPDITPKPLRSKANAIINFVGFIGAIFAGILALLFKMPLNFGEPSGIIFPFIITSVLMLLALILLLVKIKENKIIVQMEADMKLGETFSDSIEEISEDKPLSKTDSFNLKIIIISVFFWFLAFNALETFWSTYGEEYLLTQSWSFATIILTVSSMIFFLPSGWISNKIGRKKSVMVGLSFMIIGLFFASQMTSFNAGLIALFSVSGIGWALVNVNSYPMVVELASKKNVGKYTGYYYTSSMVAQSVTPVFMGALMDTIGMQYFFPYAFTFTLVSLIIFSFIKTKSKELQKK
ncbi:MAG: MFS transporter [Clostridia bacterium]|nr:MFS transporter [Clostridia bacterium]